MTSKKADLARLSRAGTFATHYHYATQRAFLYFQKVYHSSKRVALFPFGVVCCVLGWYDGQNRRKRLMRNSLLLCLGHFGTSFEREY